MLVVGHRAVGASYLVPCTNLPNEPIDIDTPVMAPLRSDVCAGRYFAILNQRQ
jgi:hypothetical protein